MSLFMACTSMLLLASRTFNSLMTQVMLPPLASIWCFCSASFSTSLSPRSRLSPAALLKRMEFIMFFIFIICIIIFIVSILESPWWELLLMELYGEKVLRFFIWCIILANMLAMSLICSYSLPLLIMVLVNL